MFERRTRIVLALLVLICTGMLFRAGQLQIAQSNEWQEVAAATMRRSKLTETDRGRILDRNGEVLAVDVPCNDAAVPYWFITDPPDEKRLYVVARDIAREKPGYFELTRKQQHELVTSLLPDAEQRLERMWEILAEIGGVPRAEIEQTRKSIVERVQKRRKWIIYSRFERAIEQHNGQGMSPWWRRWLMGEADAPPELAEFDETIAEEEQAHVILSDISTEAYNQLRKMRDELPGLTLIASQTRRYPYANAVSHVVGRVGKVTADDLRQDPFVDDELKSYLPNDLIGQSGVERVSETRLRGRRGRLDLDLQSEKETLAAEDEPGEDVQTTLDIRLQQEIRAAFEDVSYRFAREDGESQAKTVSGPAPGAAVVIDVKTGGVLAMVSYPDFDPNTYAEDLPEMLYDLINRPLINRATQFAAVPGSTIKPIVGLGGITDGHLEPHGTIECDGYLHINGQPYKSGFRCWVASMFNVTHADTQDPHPTPGLNPVDPPVNHLTLADAVQRSCNVFFETLAERMGEEGLNRWFLAFGLGQSSDLGLGEQKGSILRDMPESVRKAADRLRAAIWFGGIGQGQVQATPLQMANVAATLARGGIFVPASLTEEQVKEHLKQSHDLKIHPDALDMARRGMKAVVETPGGSGHDIKDRLPIVIAGKTGSAQAHALKVYARGADGEFLEDENGRRISEEVALSTSSWTNPEAPWYRRVNKLSNQKSRQSHAWFIGYAPADNPTVAFAVMVEYGGSGGVSAGDVAADVVAACARHGYITPTREADGFEPLTGWDDLE